MKSHRGIWVKDIVRTIEHVHYIPANWRELEVKKQKYDVVWGGDSQKERLLREWDNGSGWVEAPFCISMGNSGRISLSGNTATKHT